jgi:hypothetical protein
MANFNNNSNGTDSKAKEINYERGVFLGVQYDNQELAIQAGALTYARRDLKNTLKVIKELKVKKSDKDVLQALYNIKKAAILENIAERATKLDTAGLVL